MSAFPAAECTDACWGGGPALADESDRDAPRPVDAVLDFRDVVPIVTNNADGDLVLQVTDGVSLVELSKGATGSVEQAILGAQRLGTEAFRYAAELRREAGQRPAAVTN